MVMLEQVKALKPGDYIEDSGVFYKVLGVGKNELALTNPFQSGSKPQGRLSYTLDSEFAEHDFYSWRIIRAGTNEARAIEGRKPKNKH